MKRFTQHMEEKWSQKYKRSINCSHPKGFSQRAHCQGRKIHEGSHDFKDFKDPWSVMSPEDRKEANRLTIKILKTMPSSPRQRELQAKRDAILKKYGIGQKKTA